MSARQLAHLGFLLLGAYLMVESLALVVGSLNDRPLIWQSGGSSESSGIQTLLLAIAAGIVGAVAFGFVPGAAIIAKSGQWAANLFSESEATSHVSLAVLYPLGLLLLGLNFGLQGIAAVVGGVVQLVMSNESTIAWGASTFASGATHLVAGIVLFIMGRRAALNAD